ncbi:MAG: DNA topoisomerase IV subunit A [Alphaproteobacteria bacterium]|nr:DNA topoisomerase IV subunit A [Alphaproteobacteria bacterium]
MINTPLSEALSERYLAYAMSTIVSRSLPDVRDGMKPVHRRLLFAMRILKLDPASGFKKCARVVGDVIGKYHPHGDTAVYEAMVRLSQDFAVRYPLVEGQGNFGSIDGDNPAAMRYTEARLTEVAETIMEGLIENAVDFRLTYDGEEEEPTVMPAAFPNLLANGTSGIAVGMATNVPPHNAGELCDALLHLIKKPEATVKHLTKYVLGPDFPTGGTLVQSHESIIDAYEKGRGAFRIRAKWEVEQLSHGMYHIIITEIPYQVQKSRLIERIADFIMTRKIPILADVRDESTEVIRMVLEPKSRAVDPEQLMEQLYKNTDLEVKFNMNMNVLDATGTPRVMDLKEVLRAFLDHRHDVLIRRSNFRLGKINYRLEVLEGLLVTYLNLDEIIRIIREEDKVKECLKKTFDLTDIQVEAILNTRLRALRKLEEEAIRTEYDELLKEKEALENLLENKELRWTTISDQIKEIKKQFGQKTEIGARRTEIGDTPTTVIVPIESMIEKEPITIILSEKGWVRAMKGHVDLGDDFKFKEGDKLQFALHAYTTDKVIIFGSDGRFFTLLANDLPRGRGFGEPLRLMVELGEGNEVVAVKLHHPEGKLLVASTSGRGFIVEESSVIAQTKNGKKVLNVAAGDKAEICLVVKDNADSVAVVGNNRKMLIFNIDELPTMGRGRGVFLQKYKGGGISDVTTFVMEEGLSWTTGRGTTVENHLLAWIGKRAQVGRLPPRGFPKNNKFAS